MSPPPNITVNFPVPFPSMVVGDGAVKLTKINGVWHVGFSYPNQLDRIPASRDFASNTVLYWDPVTAGYYQLSFTELFGLIGQIPLPAFDTAGGTYNVTTETVVLANKTVSAAHSIQLPLISARYGVPVVIKDFKGDCAANNITILPTSPETIEGAANRVLNTNYARIKLVPLGGQTAPAKWYVD